MCFSTGNYRQAATGVPEETEKMVLEARKQPGNVSMP